MKPIEFSVFIIFCHFTTYLFIIFSIGLISILPSKLKETSTLSPNLIFNVSLKPCGIIRAGDPPADVTVLIILFTSMLRFILISTLCL
nr:MAG TPA: hypothetical protein [Caudoviricetes sp.]